MSAAAPVPTPTGTEREPVSFVRGRLVREGTGVRNIVAIGTRDLPDLDPFLLFAEFGGDEPEDYLGGFPDHPHRGFETVTYVLEGRLRHADSRGNAGLLGPGAVQRMKAARGLTHTEMPDQANGRLRAFQLWLNLPGRNKMDDPRYQDVPADRIPTFERDGITGRLLIGRAFGIESPIEPGLTEALYLDLQLSPGATLTVPLPREHTAFAYVCEGSARFSHVIAPAETAVVLSPGDQVTFSADEATRLLLLAAMPIRETVARHGPFVMNTPVEILQAIADYQEGRFGS